MRFFRLGGLLALAFALMGSGAAAEEPVTGSVLCHGVSPKGQPISPAGWFPKGSRAVYVWFRAGDVPRGTRAQVRWSLNGGTLRTSEVPLTPGRPAWDRYEVAVGEPLPLGRYEATVSLSDRVVARVGGRVGGDEPLGDEARAVPPQDLPGAGDGPAATRTGLESSQVPSGARLVRAERPPEVAPVIQASAPAETGPPVLVTGPAVVRRPVDAVAPETPALQAAGPRSDIADAGPPAPLVASGMVATPSVEPGSMAIRIAPEPPPVAEMPPVLRVSASSPAPGAPSWTAGAGVLSQPAAPAVGPPTVPIATGPPITIPKSAPGVVTIYPPVLETAMPPAGSVPAPVPDTAPPAASQDAQIQVPAARGEPLGPRTLEPSGARRVVFSPEAQDQPVTSRAAVLPSAQPAGSAPKLMPPVRTQAPAPEPVSTGSRPLMARASAGPGEAATPSARGAEQALSDAPSASGQAALLLPNPTRSRPIVGGPAPDEPTVDTPPAVVKPLLSSSASESVSAAVGEFVPSGVDPQTAGTSPEPQVRPGSVQAPPAPVLPAVAVPAPEPPVADPAAPATSPANDSVSVPGEVPPVPAASDPPPATGNTAPEPAAVDTAPPASFGAPLVASVGAEDLPPVALPDAAVKLHYVALTATPEPAGLQPLWIARMPDGRLWPPGMPTQLGLYAGENPDPDPSALLLYSDHVDGITPLYEVPRGEAMLHAARENDAAVLYVNRDMFDQRRQAWLETARDWRWMWYVRQVDLSLGQSVAACLSDLKRSRRVPEEYQATGRAECLLIGPDGGLTPPAPLTGGLCAALAPTLEGASGVPTEDPDEFVSGMEAQGSQGLTAWVAPLTGRYQVWVALPVDRAAATCRVWVGK